MSARIRTEPETHQAVCDHCGWHTIPMRERGNVERLGVLHDKTCPAPPPPRNGALMRCGCWTFKVVGGLSEGNRAWCDIHGSTFYEKMNVPEPPPPAPRGNSERAARFDGRPVGREPLHVG